MASEELGASVRGPRGQRPQVTSRKWGGTGLSLQWGSELAQGCMPRLACGTWGAESAGRGRQLHPLCRETAPLCLREELLS